MSATAPKASPAAAPQSAAQKLAANNNKEVKSGIKHYKQGDVLFREKDPAESLFIIQKGQIRLFVQKGKGFVDIAILRVGEVIGEMAYFDDKNARRSCSAEAMTNLEVVEISFKAFDKTMQGVNPWFRTIVNTLAERLRKTNDKVKALESNSVGFGSDGKVGNYVFFHSIDIVRMLQLMYLLYKAQGEMKDNKVHLHFDKIKMSMVDIFNISEVKLEELLNILKAEGLITVVNDENKLPKVYVIDSTETYKQFMVFFNTQRMLEDAKKLSISSKCQVFLAAIIVQLQGKADKEGKAVADIGKIMGEFKAKNVAITEEDLADASRAGHNGDIMVNDGVVSTIVQITKLEKLFPSIRLMNAIKKLNEKKSTS